MSLEVPGSQLGSVVDSGCVPVVGLTRRSRAMSRSTDYLNDESSDSGHHRSLDMRCPYDRELAARLLTQEGCLGVQLSTTFVLLTLADSTHIKAVNLQKGRDSSRVATLVVSPSTLSAICEQVDLNRVHPDYQRIVSHPESLRTIAGALHVRLPISEGFSVFGQTSSPHFVSENNDGQWIQVLCPADSPTRDLIRTLEAHAGLLAATSMNNSSIEEPTITDCRRALEFCRERNIISVFDGRISQGSFKILRFSPKGAVVERDGRAANITVLLNEARKRAEARHEVR